MRISVVLMLGLFAAGCSTTETDNNTYHIPTAVHTRITFEPLDRDQAQHYLQAERQNYKVYTDPMFERKAGLERGRDERYEELRAEFPECTRQRHCMQHVSMGDVKKFERYNDITKEINAYDVQLVELDTALRDWKARLELRTRAILNRFLVHEVMQLPTYEKHFQGILPYSLEHFESRRQLSLDLLRYAPNGERLEPQFLGDYDFRMLGRPVDEAAVVATFEVYLAPPLNELDQPTRYVVSMLINTHQLDLRFYDKDFLRAWSDKFIEPFQKELKLEAYCGVYSIAGNTLAPRLDLSRVKDCAPYRAEMRSLDATRFPDRFSPDRWLVPLAYYPMGKR
jgi:hypothetical protein